MKKMLDFVVRSNAQLNDRNHLLRVSPVTNETLPEMLPGQFVQIRVDDSPGTYLRRPISINFVDYAANEIWLLVQRVGDGTAKICDLKPGKTLNMLYPLGNSFSVPDSKPVKTLLVGGGVGMAPMLFLGKILKDKGYLPDFLLGGRSAKDLLLLEEFEKYGRVYCTTEDGSEGEKGFVSDHSLLQNEKFGKIYTCGPKPMMLAVAKYARYQGVDCEVSLENLMACGIGACLCCVEKTTRGNVCACTEGPVFNINELRWID
ncbi:MAG: dihydroorotate dehydrogenase electron transfer subunit [Dysgonamonadaceae bacterium]|jgi:dihydroorotate dehydrogenase electron transfer subunit|nr:dihydroorotate dehydrogenase electron transfer subunit [Dysgonamonadaceae bacterium]